MDCGHVCCEIRGNRYHSHTVDPADCDGCAMETAAALQAPVENRRFYVLICHACDDMVIPFSSPEARGMWASAHTQFTGHNDWYVVDQTVLVHPRGVEHVFLDGACSCGQLELGVTGAAD